MATRIALFRGINVGGRNLLPMRELVAQLESLGLQDVSTYIQSGNVVFRSEESDSSSLSERIQAAIAASHGFAPHVLLLSLNELEEAAASNPFPEAEVDPRTLHLFFLASEPTDPDTESLEASRADDERYGLIGSTFYLHAPSGIGRSKLAQRVERSLGVAATGRNWRTVVKVLEIARAR